MKILITGASGFIGQAVLKELLEQYPNDEIISLTSSPSEKVRSVLHHNYQFSETYLQDNNCSEIDVLLHVGAFTPKNSSEANKLSNSNQNIYNTEKLLFSTTKVQRIIFISTLDIYKESVIIDEQTDIDPISLYGWSKLYCEKIIQQYANENNINYHILRLGHVFGPGEEKYKKIIPLTMEKALNGQPIEIYGDGNAIRTFIYIDDVAKAIVNAIRLNGSHTINITGEEQITINRLVEKIISFSDNPIKVTHKEVDIPNRNLIFNNSLLKKLLLDSLTSLDQGLKKEYAYMEQKLL